METQRPVGAHYLENHNGATERVTACHAHAQSVEDVYTRQHTGTTVAKPVLGIYFPRMADSGGDQ